MASKKKKPVGHPPSVIKYLSRVGAEVLNFRRAMVKSFKGQYYEEKAVIRIHPDGTVTSSSKEYAPTEEEAELMAKELAKCEFPSTIQARTAAGLRGLTKGTLYEFLDRATGQIIMVQERRVNNDGTKSYLPWVMLSTGEWVSMEPDGPLPFWKPKERKGPGAYIMIHEGAKAAQAAERIVRNNEPHPWRDELELYEHWGMIGGALAPHRTDYDELRREAPSEVIYACDNDHFGIAALPKVSRNWGKSLKGIVFGKHFPKAFDMADPMPPELFNKSGRYLGPRLIDLTEAATWATEKVNTAEGKPIVVLRSEFAEEWVHCMTPDVFLHKDWPNRILTASEFNDKVAPFSSVDDTARIVKKEFAGKTAALKYIPSQPPGVYSGSEAGIYVNTFQPSRVRAEKGDPKLWVDFINHLVVDKDDLKETIRWVATLVCRPDIKMLYGMLLISETQGIGKGTLGEKILAPLIGDVNVSYPSEQEIVESNFNYWLAHKRLAVVHEIYAGQSSKAYNKLKSTITDRYITVQKKYQASYEVENWIHIFACSNSKRAIKLSMDDRRWFVPKITDDRKPVDYWERLNRWLSEEGGLGIIKWWLEEWLKKNPPVERGAAAPWSALKREIVEEGYSPGQAIVARILDSVKQRIEAGELPKDTFLIDTDLVNAIKQELYEGRHNDRLERPLTVRNIAKTMGWFSGESKAMIKGWGPTTSWGRIISLDKKTAETRPALLGGDSLPEDERRLPFLIQGEM